MATGIQLKWLPGINSIATPIKTGLVETLTKSAYPMSACIPSISASFSIHSNSDLPSAFACEAARFGSACFESLIDINPSASSSRSLGWPLIRSYYAAFFAAHTLLRLCGESITYISSKNATQLNDLGFMYMGFKPLFSKGLYHFKVSSGGHLLTINSIKTGGGGSHEELWKYFFNYLKDVENQLASVYGVLPEAITAIQTSKFLRTGLSRNNSTSGGWLSQVRNSVNYQHDHGVWFPYKVRQKNANLLNAAFANWHSNSSDWQIRFKEPDSLLAHVNLSQGISAILASTLKDISSRNIANSKSFVDRLPLAYVRQHVPGW